jgi:hypothetical protein
MNKFFLEAVFSVVPVMAFASQAETLPGALVITQAETCTEHDLLVQKIDNAYHTQFRIDCAPAGVLTMKTPVNRNAHSDNQELSQQ